MRERERLVCYNKTINSTKVAYSLLIMAAMAEMMERLKVQPLMALVVFHPQS
jgi:hypothetical protein